MPCCLFEDAHTLLQKRNIAGLGKHTGHKKVKQQKLETVKKTTLRPEALARGVPHIALGNVAD